MVLNDIEKLLEKYENGETNLKEEQQLKTYFLKENVAPHLETYKPAFAYFSENKQERFTKKVLLNTKHPINFRWISVAAAVVLLFGFYMGKSFNNNDLGTIEDPEIAFNEISKTLEMISHQFNKGTSTVGYLNEVEHATSIIFKSN
tara:strand:- start:36201 stop:36638 length:438 start_codon:yes stop_codon:yes gene_type:complete